MLKVPLYTQPPKSQLCGLYALKMIYAYYGIQKTIRELRKAIKLHSFGTYSADLGIDLLKSGFEVEFVVWDSRFFSPRYRKMTQRQIVFDLKRQIKKKKKWKDALTRFIYFIKAGGLLSPRIATLIEIQKAVKDRTPPIVCIERSSLYHTYKDKLAKHRGHFVIPIAFKGKQAVINDPHPKNKKPISVDNNQLLFAMYSQRGYVLLIKPKNKGTRLKSA